jgi:hypothetical protein
MPSDDISAIINVVNLYPLAVDTRKWELFDLIFTPDVHADFATPTPWTDLASLKRDFKAVHDPFDHTQHVVTNHVVVVDGDRADCTSYVRARLSREAPGGNIFEMAGWYDDGLVRTSAGWRIKSRKTNIIWMGGEPRVLMPDSDGTVPTGLPAFHTVANAGAIPTVKALLGKR